MALVHPFIMQVDVCRVWRCCSGWINPLEDGLRAGLSCVQLNEGSTKAMATEFNAKERSIVLYRFVSEDAADVIMLKGDGEIALRFLGKDLTARGIITAEQLPAAIAVLEEAIQSHRSAASTSDASDDAQECQTEPIVDISQRLVPLLKVLRIAYEGQKSVTWRT